MLLLQTTGKSNFKNIFFYKNSTDFEALFPNMYLLHFTWWYLTMSSIILTSWNDSVVWQFSIWDTTWQNQQNECARIEDSDQPGHPPSLNRVFAVRMKKAWVLSYPLSAQRRLCQVWSESLLGAQPHCWFCHVAAQINFLNQSLNCWHKILVNNRKGIQIRFNRYVTNSDRRSSINPKLLRL